MNKAFGVRWLLVGLGAFALFGAVEKDARACGGEWIPAVEVDHRPEGIARAEKLLDKGQNEAAAGMIIRMMPHIRGLKAEKSTLVARAQRILAVTTARSSGALKVGAQVPDYAQGTWLGKTEKQRAQNLEWSVVALKSVGATKGDDPGVQSDLAEAMSKVAAHRTEAKQILEKLAKKDLIASPEAYAALAELRAEAGDSAGQKVALKRCESMAKSANVCKANA
jgi:hypothetical protein